MREVELVLDRETGRLELWVRGILGPACDDVARLARELLGEPSREEQTAEYRLRPVVRPQVRPRGGAGPAARRPTRPPAMRLRLLPGSAARRQPTP